MDADSSTVWSRCADASQSEGSIPDRILLRWLDATEQGAAADLGQRIWASMREPVNLFDQEYPLGAALLEPGDSVTIAQDSLGLVDSPSWVESLELAGSRVRLRTRRPEAGEVCWQEDAQTFIRGFGFGHRLVLFIGGVPVGAITREGALRLRGRLTEDAGFAAGPFAGAIVHSGGYLYWSTGSGGSFDPFLRIDANGNAELKGAVREESVLAFTLDGECFGADAGSFRLMPDPAQGALEFETSSSVLHLANRLTEEIET